MKIRIYQISEKRDTQRIKFENYEEMQQCQGTTDINAAIYDQKFMGDVDCADLEDIYQLFNTEGHRLHRGHSLSVSDIIEVIDGQKSEFYYCDSFGFKKIPFHPEQARKEDNLIRVLVIEPHRKPYESEIENTLKGQQRAVEGLIEYINNNDGTMLVLNEEGKLNGMEGNRRMNGDVLCGPFFIAGIAGEKLCSLDDEQLAKYSEQFAQPDENITPEEIESHIRITFMTW